MPKVSLEICRGIYVGTGILSFDRGADFPWGCIGAITEDLTRLCSSSATVII